MKKRFITSRSGEKTCITTPRIQIELILDCAYIFSCLKLTVYDVLRIGLHHICEIKYQNISFHSKEQLMVQIIIFNISRWTLNLLTIEPAHEFLVFVDSSEHSLLAHIK